MQLHVGDEFFRERWRFASLAALGGLQVAILFKFDHGLHFGPGIFGFAPKGADSFPLIAIFFRFLFDFFPICRVFSDFNFFHVVVGGALAASGLLIFRARPCSNLERAGPRFGGGRFALL